MCASTLKHKNDKLQEQIQIRELTDVISEVRMTSVYSEDIAKAIHNKDYRKQSETVMSFIKKFEHYLKDAKFTLGQTNDIQYALRKAAEDVLGGK